MRIFLVFTILFITAAACCKKKYDEISHDDMTWLPYQSKDTLHFKSNLGNSDRWIVLSRDLVEGNYGKRSGIGGANCSVKYYYSPVCSVNRQGDAVDYNFTMIKDLDGRSEIGISDASNSAGTSNAYIPGSDTLLIYSAGVIKTSIEYIKLKKNVGLISYKIKNSNEIYEKY